MWFEKSHVLDIKLDHVDGEIIMSALMGEMMARQWEEHRTGGRAMSQTLWR